MSSSGVRVPHPVQITVSSSSCRVASVDDAASDASLLMSALTMVVSTVSIFFTTVTVFVSVGEVVAEEVDAEELDDLTIVVFTTLAAGFFITWRCMANTDDDDAILYVNLNQSNFCTNAQVESATQMQHKRYADR